MKKRVINSYITCENDEGVAIDRRMAKARQ